MKIYNWVIGATLPAVVWFARVYSVLSTKFPRALLDKLSSSVNDKIPGKEFK